MPNRGPRSEESGKAPEDSSQSNDYTRSGRGSFADLLDVFEIIWMDLEQAFQFRHKEPVKPEGSARVETAVIGDGQHLQESEVTALELTIQRLVGESIPTVPY